MSEYSYTEMSPRWWSHFQNCITRWILINKSIKYETFIDFIRLKKYFKCFRNEQRRRRRSVSEEENEEKVNKELWTPVSCLENVLFFLPETHERNVISGYAIYYTNVVLSRGNKWRENSIALPLSLDSFFSNTPRIKVI